MENALVDYTHARQISVSLALTNLVGRVTLAEKKKMVLVTNKKKLGPALQNEEVQVCVVYQMWIRIFCHASLQKKMPRLILQCPKVQNKILFHPLLWTQYILESF
ncbi:uncharacterized protein LOC128163630 isoform X1 [Crassostrea angulata]|uniref:uncharacterized protein LOC128163630 isoform X1 n=1 Tax=Magallana angulata TaxID=2784310 RepID=UPI0022B13E7D|nr:uncharacterized protein LOC128163630 isoform X1 [Crassostrea angulata]